MKELERFIKKDKQKKFLEIFLIIDQISQSEDIISFIYEDNLLIVKVSDNDYYRIWIREVEND